VDRAGSERCGPLVTDVVELWKSCTDTLRVQVSEATWKTWFVGLEPVTVEADTLVLAVPNTLVRERLEGRYLAMVTDAVAEATGNNLAVQLRVRAPDGPLADAVEDPSFSTGSTTGFTGPPGVTPDAMADNGTHEATSPSPGRGGNGMGTVGPARASSRPPDEDIAYRPPETVLNPRYTFEAFVIGASNRFAHAAAQRVAETPASSYNPLFIHGDSGLGKTHLLHAIGHYVGENFPTSHIRYVSTETFMNEFVDGIRANTLPAFKRRYRACDVLLVDDIQFMENKEGLQEEFFHTFNSLYEASKQIVLSSDRHPRSIATLEDRLRSRFEWGLTTDVQPPELETRLAILRKKAEGERAYVPDEVLELIATHVKDNIRELEGALIRVSAFASLNREPLTRELAEMVLSDILANEEPRQITPQVILEATASTFGFSIDDLCGTSRRRPLVNARQIGMYVFRDLTDFSYPAIAREFGGRDHTTVIHAVEKISGLMRERRQVYDQVTALIHRIKSGG
jgi:chromosomal replication initiator protein